MARTRPRAFLQTPHASASVVAGAPFVWSCEVVGLPRPQGSTSAYRRSDGSIAITSATKGLKAWRTEVAWTVRAARGARLVHRGAVSLTAEFRLPRPKRPTRPYPARYDLDKLIRAVGDALTQVVYVDDVAVVGWDARKRLCQDGEVPGVALQGAEW